MGPIGLQDDPHLTMSAAERRAAAKARRAKFFPRNIEAEIKVAQIMETPLVQTPPEPIQVSEPVDDSFERWLAYWRNQPAPVEPEVAKCPDVRTIQKVCCAHFKVSMLDFLSIRRTADVVRPRQIAMYLCKTITMKSLPDIGRRFGGRDHTTVLHAVRKIEGLIARDPKVAAVVDELKQQLSVD